MKKWAEEVAGQFQELESRIDQQRVTLAAPIVTNGSDGGAYGGTFYGVATNIVIPSNAIGRAHYMNCSIASDVTLPNARRGGWVIINNVGAAAATIKNQAGTTLAVLATNEQAMFYVVSDFSNVLSWGISPAIWNTSTGAVKYAGMTISGLTASRLVVTDANKALASNAALTSNGFLFGGGSGAVTSTAAATDGQLLIGRTSGAPAAATITGTANRVTVTNGANSITLSGPQDIHTAATPTFASVFANLFRPTALGSAATFRGWDTSGIGDAGTDATLRGGDGSTGMSGVAGGNVHIRGGIGTTVGYVKIYRSNGTTVTVWCNDTGLGFFGATPVAQQATTGTATGFTAGAGTAVKDDSTFTGGVGSTAYRISDIVLALKNLGLLAQ